MCHFDVSDIQLAKPEGRWKVQGVFTWRLQNS